MPTNATGAGAARGRSWPDGRRPAADDVHAGIPESGGPTGEATLAPARRLKEQSRMLGVETAVRALFARARQPPDVVIEAAELLASCGRIQAAADVCHNAIVAGAEDARLHACAAQLDLQLGAFARAREHSVFALSRDARALEWGSARVLVACREHVEAADADFDLLRCYLQRPGLGAAARASVLFALGKAHDDVGDVAAAVRCLREAHAVQRRRDSPSRGNFRQEVAARLAHRWPVQRATRAADFTPVFVVGAPWSGAAAVAGLIGTDARVCDRGEPGHLHELAGLLDGAPEFADLDAAAVAYARRMRQDDTAAAWFIDRTPLNLLHLDLVTALFPNARIIVCLRHPRDTALSMWMHGGEGSPCDFADIAALVQGGDALIANARERHGLAILAVRHEELLARPTANRRALCAWIGLPDEPGADAHDATPTPIALPVGRWRSYLPHLPELLAFEDA